MKKVWATAIVVLASSYFSQGSIIFSDDFNTTDQNLVGYNNWAETSPSATPIIQIQNQAVSLANTGQDANRTFSSIQNTAGTSFYIGIDIIITAAKATGDYFLNTSTSATGNFFDRLYAKSSGSGFVLGVAPNNTGFTYGSTVLSLNTDYKVILRYDFVNGSGNDSVTLYVNPTDSTEGNNLVYDTAMATSSSTDPASIGTINFRQGNFLDAPTETVDNLIVATTFMEALPESNDWGAISSLGLLAFCGLRIWRWHQSGKTIFRIC